MTESQDHPPYSKQLRLKNAETHQCPLCGMPNTIRYSKRWKCHSCGTRWTAFKLWYQIWLSKRGRLPYVSSILLPAAAILSVLYLLITVLHDDPVHLIKTSVRQHYDQKYGSQSRQRLKQDFGWWYDSKSDARNDYTDHNPNR